MERSSKCKTTFINNCLSEDVLYLILCHLDDIDDLKSMSLVCKLLCSLSSLFFRKLILSNSSLTYSRYRELFIRFSCVTEIHINFVELDNALLEISKSDLNLEKLHLPGLCYNRKNQAQMIENLSKSRVIKSIKSLELKGPVDAEQVVEFRHLFPSLIELAFKNSCTLKDKEIHMFTSKLPNLQKISLHFNNLLTDETLCILSSNCPKLHSVNFQWCGNFTPEALYTFFCNYPQLSSVYMPRFQSPPSISKVIECMKVLPSINHLSLECDYIQDAVLISLAKSRPPLKSLIIGSFVLREYTFTALSQLLSACPGLESLGIHLPHFKKKFHDLEMSIIVKRLPNLKRIMVWSRVFCQATLFSLVENCPLLETIFINSDTHFSVKQVYCDQGTTRLTKKNYSIKSIRLIPKSDIWRLPTVKLC